ncbi:TlpA family protein disulfide reductase [Oceanithermus desulfurans]|uniref:Thioredoxin domain-containing protein n=2 Tax=Oceanithermus desulfurans TaxID=227924 RepID=A0A511RK08_9DEIN|nr:hypothetical protein [Oceanithermus desulfurans]MBB6029359.1 hypothetical protein [Oceanithermus desulfurans]GEM89985.1 hypothetical protein ODE01S_14190 [Oceanithermus desulfurans NBRC 100063]
MVKKERPPAAPMAGSAWWLPRATLALALLMVLAAVAVGAFHTRREAGRLGALRVGQALPELVFASREGPVGLYSRLNDTGLTLLAFFSATCDACPEDLRDLTEWLNADPSRPLRAVVIADELARPEDYEAPPGRLEWLFDPGLRQSRRRLRIGGVPSYVVVDEQGTIVYLQRGRRLKRGANVLLAELEHLVDHHLGEEDEP